MNRREFSGPIKAQIKARSRGRCESYRMPPDIRHLFPKACDRPARDVDHIYADILDLEKDAPLTAEDGAHICVACHRLKTMDDQAKRKKRNAHAVRKDRPKSGLWAKGKTKWPKGQKIRSRNNLRKGKT